MDVAIRLEVEESPLSLARQQKVSVPVFTKHILRIDSLSNEPEHDYIQETIYFSTSSLSAAANHISSNGQQDAILINPADVTSEAELANLKTLAQKKAIPFILYTSNFDQSAKSLALKMGVDEYHYGGITYAFLKRIEFIKKLKNYKNQRGNKPYLTQQVLEEIPKIKLWTLKRTFDILVSLTVLLCLLPVMLVIALIIKLESKGPVFYISKRAGAGYRIFNFYKFRSMRVGADVELKKLAHLNQYAENDANGVFFKIKNDPRVTRFGNFIRNTSLDELPQLINVLIGDMSLVGNRPLPLYEAEKLTKDQIAWRFLAPAGITGLWQVTKRGKENMSPEERIALDTEYAMKNSFWLDIKILFSTIPALLQKEKV
ncbi:MAG TPA: sugar transferase [Ohtaekwangia sp.]|nr:sugar transferase [Ohtaekwangia sp.]